tara:strand:- start:8952 stop:10106 length:1155 start_codon:yes stop_codon:yes gene_type:complete
MKKNLNEKYVIVPSAGIGTRFESNVPKQYIKIQGISILERTIKHFLELEIFEKIIVPIHPEDNFFEKLSISKHKKILKVKGGKSRSESVMSALNCIEKNSIIVVHDAVRPFIDKKEIISLIENFNPSDEDILVYGIPVYEALKKINQEDLFVKKSVDRNKFYLAQTPQITTSHILENSLDFCLREGFHPSDESEAIERSGGKTRIISGSRKNIKITVTEDISNKAIKSERIGNGFDSHRFEDGDGLMLGGFRVPCNKSFLAHSDGDIIIHALIDSMFGALSLGDIGDHFPDNDEKWLNISGKELFEIAYNKVLEKGFSLNQIDVVVIMEEPKLSEYKSDIILSLSNLTNLNKDRIGLKAKTSEKMGFIGKKEGAAAFVLTRLEE